MATQLKNMSVTPWGRITKGKKTVKIKNHE